MSNNSVQQRFVLAVMVLAIMLLLLSGAATRNSAQAEESAVREVVVKLKPDASISAINSSYRTTTVKKLLGSAGIYRLEVASASRVEDVVSGMKNDGRVVYAELNYAVEAPEGGAWHKARAWHKAHPDGVSTAVSTSNQYAVDATNLTCAQGISRGSGSTVAVLDTGAQLDHPVLAPNFAGVPRYDFVDDDADPSDVPVGLDADANGYADEMAGHGTHVAGIVDLVAPEAKIMPLRVLDSEGYGNVFTLVEAIYYAEKNGADVINLSLSSSQKSALLEDAVQDVFGKGVVVVAAAGNSNTQAYQWPAAVGDVVSVTSVGQDSKKSSFANYGGWVDVAAPGNDIESAFPTGNTALWSGTSMATPFVSGQAALIHSFVPVATPSVVDGAITGTARSLNNVDPAYSGKLGKGLTNVGASLGKLRPAGGCGR